MNLEDTIMYFKNNNIRCGSFEEYTRAKEYFLNPKIIDPNEKKDG